jgi:hypothetical protein
MKERDVFSELLEGMTEWREFNAGNETLRSHSSCLKPFILPARRAKGRAPAAPEKPGRADAPPAFPLRVFPVYCPLSSCFFFSLL